MSLPKAIVLFSGGLDSTTCLAIAHENGFEPVLLSFDYGQQHDDQARGGWVGTVQAGYEHKFGVNQHHVAKIPVLGSTLSSLSKDGPEVPKGGDPRAPGVPNTYVPARNLIFLSVAVSLAEKIGAEVILIGCSQIDYSGYPDCRGEFLDAFEAAVWIGTKTGAEGNGIKINAPLLNMTKADTIRLGLRLGVDYAQTSSCYDPQHRDVTCEDGIHGYSETLACGLCDSCQLRLEAFRTVGIEDPISYVEVPTA